MHDKGTAGFESWTMGRLAAGVKGAQLMAIGQQAVAQCPDIEQALPWLSRVFRLVSIAIRQGRSSVCA